MRARSILHRPKKVVSSLVIIGSIALTLFLIAYALRFEEQLAFNLREIIFTVAGGLALFLFGMEMLSSGLKKLAGNRLKNILQSLTRAPLIGVLLGIGATAVLQSSSATTVMVVGFINTGLVKLTSGIGVIMGANIGTTITGQIIAFSLEDFALPVLAIGVFMALFSKSERIKYSGDILAGFGLLFFGLALMKTELAIVGQNPAFKEVFANLSSFPILGMLASAIFTLVVQSSSATIGIIIALSATGAISLEGALPLILGLNIGTTITANVAAINASENAKRAARIHFIFNTLGALLFLVLLTPFSAIVKAISAGAPAPRLVANAHTIFNVVSTVIFIPFIPLLVKLSFLMIPKTDREKELSYLDNSSLEDPSVALDQIRNATLEMQKFAAKSIKILKRYVIDQDEDKGHALLELEIKLDNYQERTLEYLSELGKADLTEIQSARMTSYIHIINHLEQIGDLIENVEEVPRKMRARELNFNSKQRKALRKSIKHIEKLMKAVRLAIRNEDVKHYEDVVECFREWQKNKEDILSSNRRLVMSKRINIDRINYFVDIVLPLTEIAKKCTNIAWESKEQYDEVNLT